MQDKLLQTIFDLIDSEQFRRVPNMYLGQNSITRLRIFMDGYDSCQRFNNIQPIDTNPSFFLFYCWLCKIHNYNGGLSWDGLILLHNQNNESKALTCFFEKLDEFRNSKIIKIYKCKLNEHSSNLYLGEYSGGIGSTLHHMSSKIQMNSRYFEDTDSALIQVKEDYPTAKKWEEIANSEFDRIYEEVIKNGI